MMEGPKLIKRMLNRIIGKPNNWWINLRRGSGVSVYGDNDVSASNLRLVSGPRNDADASANLQWQDLHRRLCLVKRRCLSSHICRLLALNEKWFIWGRRSKVHL